MSITEWIIKWLMEWCSVWSKDVVIPNFYVGQWEMDVFKMTWTWYIMEYEVKISRADFKNDFKKWDKHKLLKNWELHTNRFFYVVPEWLIKLEEVPDYCGLIYAKEYEGAPWRYHFKVIQKAKLLHKNNLSSDIDFIKKLLHKVVFRESIKTMKLNNLKRENKRLKNAYIKLKNWNI